MISPTGPHFPTEHLLECVKDSSSDDHLEHLSEFVISALFSALTSIFDNASEKHSKLANWLKFYRYAVPFAVIIYHHLKNIQ